MFNNTKTALMRNVITALGGKCEDLPDNLETTLLKRMAEAAEGGGASSWNDLAEKTAKVGGDTLTWDGNTEGKTVVQPYGDEPIFLVKVSDLTPSLSDLANGGSIGLSNGADTEDKTFSGEMVEETYAAYGIVPLGDGEGGYIVYEDNKSFEDEFTFPEKGIYFMCFDDGDVWSYPCYLTIPGYTGFVSEQTVVTPIPTEYLPEHLQFGEVAGEGGSDTLVWDGSTEGKLTTEYGLVKLSDAVLTVDDVKNGYIFAYTMDGVTEERELTAYETPTNELLILADSAIICANTDGATIDEMVFPEKGIYSFVGYILSLTIPGYGKFVSEQNVVTPLDEKYMPVLTSPGGKKFKISVDDGGVLTATEV